MEKVPQPPKRKKKAPATDHTQKAYQGLRRMFFLNEIVPGQKISYRDLAERLEMSPTPIIQALKRLEFQGLVRHEPNRGYYTEEISLQEVEEAYELRELIETSLIPRIIERIDDDGLRKLEEALGAHARAASGHSLNERLLADMAFHLALADLSGCRVQRRTLGHLFDLLYLKYRGNMLFVTSMEAPGQEHRLIFDSIRRRNAKEARQHLSRHILNVKEHALLSLRQRLTEKTGGMAF